MSSLLRWKNIDFRNKKTFEYGISTQAPNCWKNQKSDHYKERFESSIHNPYR